MVSNGAITPARPSSVAGCYAVASCYHQPPAERGIEMTDLSSTRNSLIDAAYWLLLLPEPTESHLAAAATLLGEAHNLRQGARALDGARDAYQRAIAAADVSRETSDRLRDIEVNLACGDTITCHSEPKVGAYRTCIHCGSRKKVVSIQTPIGPREDCDGDYQGDHYDGAGQQA